MTNFPVTSRSPFTEYVVTHGLLREPLCLIDVGAYGGLDERWGRLGAVLTGAGFDLNESHVEDLNRGSPSPSFRFYNMAIGSCDETRMWYERPHPWDNSLLYPENAIDYTPHQEKPADGNNSVIVAHKEIAVRTIDSLIREGIVAAPNFLKSDTEGYDLDVLAGAKEALLDHRLLGVQCETCFGPVPGAPINHFFSLYELLTAHEFVMVDFRHTRCPRQSLPMGQLEIRDGCLVSAPYGVACQHDCLFLREPKNHDRDTFLKFAIICEFYQLNDIAIDLFQKNAALFGSELTELIDLLVPPVGGSYISYDMYKRLSKELQSGRIIRVETDSVIRRLY